MQDGEVKNKLSPAQVSVMRHKVTEPPYFGKYWDHYESGTYRCAACDTVLFSSAEKFDSKTGWPTFKKPVNERDLQFKSEPGPDDKVEIRCKRCKSHLGYVIPAEQPYYRINSVCLTFEKSEPFAAAPAAEAAEKPVITVPAPVAPLDLPLEDEREPWQTRSIIAGAILGFALGALGMWLYLPHAASPAVSAATTTPETASSTDSAPAAQSPAETPEPAPETAAPEPGTAPETSTSTQ